jgi:hypothetical protein
VATFGDRIVGAMKLDISIFEEIERDTTAMGQAIGVIVIAAVASAIGAGRGYAVLTLPTTALASLIGYLAWAVAIFLIGTKLMPEPATKADFNETFRVVGFSAAPGLFSILGILPVLGYAVRFVVLIWMIAAMVVAVRQVLDYSTTAKAVIVCLIGFAAFVVINTLLAVSMMGGLSSH